MTAPAAPADTDAGTDAVGVTADDATRTGAGPADRPGDGSGGVPGASASADQPWSWHASRAAALLLVVLVPLHFAVTLLVADIGTTTARSMSERLDDPTWRMLTWLTVALALVHATLSTDAAVRVRRPGRLGLAVTVVVGLLAGALLATVTWLLTSGLP